MEVKEDGRGDWQRFRLWPAQRTAADEMQGQAQLVILKARQLGLSWLCVAFALWLMIFHSMATVLLFSLRDKESKKLLKRLRDMHDRLPGWMQEDTGGDLADNDHELEMGNGSTAQAMTKAGDSYTASLVLIDEADLIQDLEDLLDSLKPTVADGGRILLVSRSDKSRPESPFKRLYQAAKEQRTQWRHLFLPWNARPDRSEAWYAEERAASYAASGSLDDFLGNYPATDSEALAPRTLDNRLPPAWLEAVYREATAIPRHSGPAVQGLVVYREPRPGEVYVIGADPAEGNPTSDESAACVLSVTSGEQVAVLAGRIEPSAFAHAIGRVAVWYNGAAVMVERNNHGHAVILALPAGVRRLNGRDDRPGWLSSQLGKTVLYDACADAVRNGEVGVRDFGTWKQLASIEGNTLRAPEGQFDDRADAFALAVVGRLQGRPLEMRVSRTPARGVTSQVPKGVWS